MTGAQGNDSIMKDQFCAYYTESREITGYMVSRLKVEKKDVILEPSAGAGCFVDEMTEQYGPDLKIDLLDLDGDAVSIMKRKYGGCTQIRVRKTDTLLDEQLDSYSAEGGYYDRIIGNPPYGAWRTPEKREILKEKYPEQYIKESYSLFLVRCLSVLKPGGRLCFIIPDTFLYLNNHERLRRELLTTTKIEEILIFPSYYFPGISFGYSNLCIITMVKSNPEAALNNKVRIFTGFRDPLEFRLLQEGQRVEHHCIYELRQRDIFQLRRSSFLLAADNRMGLLRKGETTLGEVADVVTGFYSGDNHRFVRVRDDKVRNSKGYQQIEPDKISCEGCLEGIAGKEVYVPYVKGTSGTRYARTGDEWYLRWDRETVAFYKRNPGTRYQNPGFYFRTGVAVPMVKSKEIRATLMEGQIFDQSIVGVFPRDERKLLYLLALLNSEVVNELIHVINPTANNSCNYIKQLPYREPDEENRKRIEDNTAKILALDAIKNAARIQELHRLNNGIIGCLYAEQN